MSNNEVIMSSARVLNLHRQCDELYVLEVHWKLVNSDEEMICVIVNRNRREHIIPYLQNTHLICFQVHLQNVVNSFSVVWQKRFNIPQLPYNLREEFSCELSQRRRLKPTLQMP